MYKHTKLSKLELVGRLVGFTILVAAATNWFDIKKETEAVRHDKSVSTSPIKK